MVIINCKEPKNGSFICEKSMQLLSIVPFRHVAGAVPFPVHVALILYTFTLLVEHRS